MNELQLRHAQVTNKGQAGKRTVINEFKWGCNCTTYIFPHEKLTMKLTCHNVTKRQPQDFDPSMIEANLWKVGERGSVTKGTVNKSGTVGEYDISFPTPAVGKYAFNFNITDEKGSRNIWKDHEVMKVDVVSEEPRVVDQIAFSINAKNLSTGRVNLPFKFEIVAKDTQGNIKAIKISEIDVSFKQGNTVKSGSVISKGSNAVLHHTFAVELTPTSPGAVTISLSYGGLLAKTFQITAQ